MLVHILVNQDYDILYVFVLLSQLKMFEEMGFKVDQSSPAYKHFRLKILGMASSPRLLCCSSFMVARQRIICIITTLILLT